MIVLGLDENLKESLKRIQEEAEISVREGSSTLVLSDRNTSNKRAQIPMVLSVGAINSILVKLGLRGYCSINVETSETLDTHSCSSNRCGRYNNKSILNNR